jgi:hypothetical protein
MDTRYKVCLVLALSMVVACGKSDVEPISERLLLSSIKPENTRFVSGIIRCYSASDCSLLIDADHSVVGATGANVVNDSLFVYFPTTTKIITFIVRPDETLAQQNTVCGASVGLNNARIECSGRNSDGALVRMGPHELAQPGANLFFFGVFSN